MKPVKVEVITPARLAAVFWIPASVPTRLVLGATSPGKDQTFAAAKEAPEQAMVKTVMVAATPLVKSAKQMQDAHSRPAARQLLRATVSVQPARNMASEVNPPSHSAG